ncbi:MAG: electron transport complex subunit E [Clostridia bacterium]|nr:electron transport complex subunit E [Clostridia bacterium]
MKIKDFFKSGLITDNPVLIQLLGMCPTLATSTSLINAIGMGLSATFVLVCSNVLISLLRKFIPQKIRIASYIVIIAGFVTLVDMLLEAYFNSIYNALGVFIPLIVVNCIILARAESFASKNKVLPSLLDGLAMGLGFTFALCILGTIREILGNGTILGFELFGGVAPLSLFALPAGGFLTLGFVIAFVQHLSNRKKGGAE